MRITNHVIDRRRARVLAAVPFVVLVVAYAVASHVRRAENPADKLLPSLDAMARAFVSLATEPDKRSGDILLWTDTLDSLMRIAAGMGISTAIALVLGVAIGFVPIARALTAPFVASISLIPPITVLPILFIVAGLGEASKIALIVIGTAPVMVRSVAQAVIEIPRELVIKAETLGASVWQIATRLVMPQAFPQLVTAIRLGLAPGWIFLVSAEAIASTSGLGYRIFLVRRYLAMDVIIPYVLWITLLAIVIDRLLLVLSRRAFRWRHLEGQSL